MNKNINTLRNIDKVPKNTFKKTNGKEKYFEGSLVSSLFVLMKEDEHQTNGLKSTSARS